MLNALRRSFVEGVIGDCKGGDYESPPYEKPYDFYSEGPSCMNCKVDIKSEWNSKIPKPSTEAFILDNNAGLVTSETRLSCCVQMEKWMNGMIVQVGIN
mmetsp:Transcript_26198/g.26088  ORF Transcript_26198/g.26088 Transcript_26198/m.26088 type:complete len:99 (+) Transcript_26198:184-480(+)